MGRYLNEKGELIQIDGWIDGLRHQQGDDTGGHQAYGQSVFFIGHH